MSTESTDESWNLISINTDCKELIFEYLKWTDLISVADTSKQLHSSVCRVFNRKYCGSNARIDIGLPPFSIFDKEALKTPLQPEPVICVTRPELAFKLLRNFGQLIMNLSLEYVQFFNHKDLSSDKGHRMIEDYLAEYCSETLCQLSLHYFDVLRLFDESFFNNIQKQFRSVKTLQIIDCCFDNEFTLNIIFPNLKTLKLEWCFFRLNSLLLVHLPTVKSVEFLFGLQFKGEDIEDFFKLNQQLENAKVYLNGNHTPGLYSRLQVYCPNIKFYNNILRRSPFHLFKFINGKHYSRNKEKIYPRYTSERYKDDLEEIFLVYKKIIHRWSP